MLKKRGSRLGGRVGAITMRFMGRDGYVLSEDVVKAAFQYTFNEPIYVNATDRDQALKLQKETESATTETSTGSRHEAVVHCMGH